MADIKVASQALAELHTSGERPEQAGWLAWDEIREEWSEEEDIESKDISL